MPANSPPQPNMDESWASLDVSDFSHDDDDTESVNTDGGSLVDLSSVHDTESAVEDESQSEMGVDEERDSVVDMLGRGLSRHAEQAGQPDQQEATSYDDVGDAIILQQSATQSAPSAIDMEYVRDVPWKSSSKTAAQEVITMAISPNDLTPFDAPVRIYYYGSQNPPDSRDELLGKIGAALLTPSSNSSSRTSTASTCFNIVPTEFGPGSKPAFADLIPSQAQMTVDELSNVTWALRKTDKICFTSTRGVVVESVLATQPSEADYGDLHPDLLVIHVTNKDLNDKGEELHQFYNLVDLAARHCWPTIIVAQDLSVSPRSPYIFRKGLGIQIDPDVNQRRSALGSKRPIDLYTFMDMDTVQLSRHIMHIMETRFIKDEGQGSGAVMEQSGSFIGNIQHFFSAKRKRDYRFILKVRESKTEPPSSLLPGPSLSKEIKQAWSIMDVRQCAKDVMLSLVVMMLGIYIVGFSQNLSSKVHGLAESNNTAMVSSKTDGTATVTATSAITTSTATAVAVVDQEVALYDPILFDQMWQRLTGRAVVDQEVEEAPKEVKVEDVVEESVEVGKESDMMHETVDQLAGWIRSKMDMVRMRVARPKVPKPLESLNKLKKQIEVREMHQRLHDFYRDVTANVPKISKAKHEYLHDLVARSHHHLKQTRWAGEKKLERLIKEQKILLSNAQHQAQHIVAAKKKRPSIFGRGRD